ncbi:MAG: TerB family tellurite resistance protein [Vulcanimicrobiota bacterium]
MPETTAFAAELRRQIEFQRELKQRLDLALVDGVVALLSIQLREIERGLKDKPTESAGSSKCRPVLELDRISEANLVNLLMAMVTADGLTKIVELRRIREYFQEQLGYAGESLQRVDYLLQNAQEKDVDTVDILTLARPFMARPQGERISIYSVCTDIAFADDEVAAEEQEFLERLAQLFQIDPEHSERMYQDHGQASAERLRALELKVRGQYPLDSPVRFERATEGESPSLKGKELESASFSGVNPGQTSASADQAPPSCKHCGTQARKSGVRFCYSCGQMLSAAAHPEVRSGAPSQTVDRIATHLDLPQALENLLAHGKIKGQLTHDEIIQALSALDVSPDQFDEILDRFVNEGIMIVDSSESDRDWSNEDWMARPINQEVLALQADVSKIVESWGAASLAELRQQSANRPKGMSGKSWERLSAFLDLEERRTGVIDGGFVPWTPEWGSLCARVFAMRNTPEGWHPHTIADLARVVQAPPPRFREAQRTALVCFLERLGEACGATYQPAPPQPEPMDVIWTAAEFTNNFVMHLRSQLKERHWYVLAARFGLDGQIVRTLEELGNELGLTRERVRQLEGRALRLVCNLTCQNRELPLWRDILSLAKQSFWSAADLWHNLLLVGLQRETDRPVVDLMLWTEDMYFFEPTSSMSDGLYFKGVAGRELPRTLSSLRSFFRDHCEESLSANQVAQTLSLEPLLVAALLKVATFVELVGDEHYTTAFSALSRPEQVLRVLSELGEPTHYETIARMVEEREGAVGGVGLRTFANVMVGDKRFVCQGRSGYWGLAEWGIESRSVLELMAEALRSAGTPLTSERIYAHVSSIRPVSPRSITAYLQQDGELFFRCGLDEWGLKAWEDDPNYADRFDLQIRDLLAEFAGAQHTSDFLLHEAAAYISRRTGMSPRSARAVLIWSPYLTIWREGWQRSRCRFHSESKAATRSERNRRVPTQQNIFDTFLTEEIFSEGPEQELTLRGLVKAAEEQLGYPPQTTYTLISRSEILEKIERDGAKFCRLVDFRPTGGPPRD